MKKILLLALTAALLFPFSSCHKDDDNPQPSVEKMIVGKWYFSAKNSSSGYEMTDCVLKSFYQFRADGTITVQGNDLDEDAGGVCVSHTASGSYSLTADKKKIILKILGGEQQAEIINLTATELVILTEEMSAPFYLEKRN